MVCRRWTGVSVSAWVSAIFFLYGVNGRGTGRLSTCRQLFKTRRRRQQLVIKHSAAEVCFPIGLQGYTQGSYRKDKMGIQAGLMSVWTELVTLTSSGVEAGQATTGPTRSTSVPGGKHVAHHKPMAHCSMQRFLFYSFWPVWPLTLLRCHQDGKTLKKFDSHVLPNELTWC